MIVADRAPTESCRPDDERLVARRVFFSTSGTAFLIAINTFVYLILPIAFKRDYPSNYMALGAARKSLALSDEWWRLITSNFLQITPDHLLGNMVPLWILGKRMERLFGSLGVVGFYLFCAVSGMIIIITIYPNDGFYGSSMCIAGMAGALFVIYGRVFFVLSKRAMLKYAALVLLVAEQVREEFAVWHIFPHTVGLLVGMSFAVVFESVGRKELNRHRTRADGLFATVDPPVHNAGMARDVSRQRIVIAVLIGCAVFAISMVAVGFQISIRDIIGTVISVAVVFGMALVLLFRDKVTLRPNKASDSDKYG
jgi:membrane associated rhomboid family serine protease